MNTVTLEVEGQKVEVDRAFLDMSPQDQEATITEIADSFEPRQTFMGNVNKGIAEAMGGVVDLLNPFDVPHSLNPFEGGTGSAVSGLEAAMEAGGVNVAQGEPDSLVNSFARGSGNAAGAAPLGLGSMQAAARLPGLLGMVGKDAAKSMSTTGGLIGELIAGGSAQGSADLAKEAGAGPMAQMLAGIAGGGATAAIPGIVRASPTTTLARRAVGTVKRAALPYTEAGGREVAKARMQSLAGGEDRARELAQRIQPGELGLTPAQLTGDPNMLAIEQEAARMNPNLRERLAARATQSQETAGQTISGMGGDPAEAQRFFAQRRGQARESIKGMIQRAAQRDLDARPSVRRTEAENSQTVVANLLDAEAEALATERDLWARVPHGTQIDTLGAQRAARAIIEETPGPSRKHIPQDILTYFDGPSGFGDVESVSELHALYSELRQTAREAMARPVPNKRQAAMANSVAEAILDDLGAGGGSSEVGQAIDTARAFSREMHEVFGQGPVGTVLKRTVNGGDRVDPQAALQSIMGTGGVKAKVGAEGVMRASDTDATEDALRDFMAGKFNENVFSGGQYRDSAARSFMRRFDPALEAIPGMRDELAGSIRMAEGAQRAAQRGNAALKSIDSNASVRAGFEQAPSNKAAQAVFSAQRPSTAAQELARTARKDPTGQAMAGLKGSFLDHLKATTKMDGDKMLSALADPETKQALSTVLEPDEFQRLATIADELSRAGKAKGQTPDIGSLSAASPNRLIENAARIWAANFGANLGDNGASLQTAQMASGQVKRLLGRLQNDKAEQMLMDAVEDAELFKMLLSDPQAVKITPETRSRLAPYFVGTGAALGAKD
ncbi:hypothetical protein [Sulfitobacter sp. W074]|uniref:hypothetical protein n=1 Tax=Sulfitobacter sp. W074 TaxID=2867026 RepID=UPI0021A349EC|nr:hypothetical protein [Sulfitobacter sp. W074]UWR37664.1 hypothetical protein K3762_01055 [Sulfitobacter sp. W074]